MRVEPAPERVIAEHALSSPEAYGIYLMHVAAYRFAEPHVRGKRVLDYGCGTGYGAAHLAEVAERVVAVDVSQEAIDYAREHWSRERLTFQRIDPDAGLPFPDGSFDTVMSNQVIEHVPDPARYLAEIRRVLVPGGTLVVATPDRSTRLFPGQRPWSRWHLTEFSSGELQRLLEAQFVDVEMFGTTATPDLLDIELRRVHRLRLLALPFTLPFMPEAWRVGVLRALHALKGPPKAPAADAPARTYPWTVDDVTIAKGATPSTSIVALARTPADTVHA